MKLATTSEVLQRLSVSEGITGAVTSAESALNAATVLISNMLETPMEAVEVIDMYSPDTTNVAGQLKLYLSHMFLNEEEIVSISYGVYAGEISPTDYIEVDPKYYSIDYVDGSIILDNVPTYGKMSLRISYLSGFSGENDSRIPSWLKEAAITAAIYVMHTQKAAHGKKDVQDVSPEYRRIIYAMIQQHLRSRMNCLFAEQTQVTV